MKTHIYTLYKVKIDFFKINKMLYGILIFIVEIYLIYLYNTIENDYWKSSGYSEIKLMLKH